MQYSIIKSSGGTCPVVYLRPLSYYGELEILSRLPLSPVVFRRVSSEPKCSVSTSHAGVPPVASENIKITAEIAEKRCTNG